MTSGILQMQSITKTFDSGVCAIKDVSFQIEAGDFVSVLGPSGCGKSTLLRLIAGLEKPTSGQIQKPSLKTRMAYVFQDAHLLPWRSAFENALLPLEFHRQLTRHERHDRVSKTLELVGLSEFASSYPAQLSGGMRMRVSLARALVTEPQLLLLDEPFAALDEITRQKLDDDLRRLWQLKQLTVIFVTHSVAEATFLSNRALVMSKRPGRIIFDQRIDLPDVRSRSIKSSTSFVELTAQLSDALENGEQGNYA